MPSYLEFAAYCAIFHAFQWLVRDLESLYYRCRLQKQLNEMGAEQKRIQEMKLERIK